MKCLVQSRQNLKWTSFFDCIQSPEPRCSPPPCSAVCEPRCECDPGYIRGYDGLCVQPEECFVDEQCPPGEHYNQCSNVCDEIYCCPNTRCGIPLQEFCYQSIGRLKNHWNFVKIKKSKWWIFEVDTGSSTLTQCRLSWTWHIITGNFHAGHFDLIPYKLYQSFSNVSLAIFTNFERLWSKMCLWWWSLQVTWNWSLCSNRGSLWTSM